LKQLRLPTDLFESARVKLTAFYFAILVVFCVVLSIGFRAATQYELDRSGLAERGTVHQLFQRYYQDYDTPTYPGSDQYFRNAQSQQAEVTQQHLNRDLFAFDVLLLFAGAVISYWYAGRTLAPIEEAHEQHKRFTSDASHELRTPLASMRLENEVFLRQKTFTEQEAREQLASNLEEVERLEKLAGNLLALNNFQHTNMPHAPGNIAEVVDEAVKRVQGRKDAKQVTFAQDVQPAKVDINRESVVELLAILLDNAVKYGPKDGKVEIGGMLGSETYTVTVRDHGPGIAEHDLPHIFERMYRGDKARSSRVGGHGIGLSLAQQIAEANEAKLEAANAPGGGAAFTLTLQ
jgi:two-component system sensor histidine kinase CiaH